MVKSNSNESGEGVIEEALKTVDFSDRLWMFCSKYTRFLASFGIALIVISAIAVALMIGRSIFRKNMERNYCDAIYVEDKEAFAKKYCSEKLGGAVFLELGDRAYRDRDYNKASNYYHCASKSLGGNIFGGRAIIGESIALIRSGEIESGENLLAKIAEEKSYPNLIRGKAMYLLAVNLWDRKETHRAKDLCNKLANSHFPEEWKNEAQLLLREI
jgi:hypothetical protein